MVINQFPLPSLLKYFTPMQTQITQARLPSQKGQQESMSQYFMGYNANCYYQTCSLNCCNYAGYCPTYSYNCYYYYSSYYSSYDSYGYSYSSRSNSLPFSDGTLAGIVVGGVAAIVITIILSCYCYRRCEQAATREAIRQYQMRQRNNPNPAFDNTHSLIILPGTMKPPSDPREAPNSHPNKPYFYQNHMIYPSYGQAYREPINPAHVGAPPMGQPVYEHPPQPVIPIET